MTGRRLLGGMGIVLGALVSLASLAFACTAQPRVFSVLPQSAPAGSTVEVGAEAVGSRGPVEIRWNGVEGPVLATAEPSPAGTLSLPLKVPETPPGVYSLVFVTPDQGIGRAALEVTSSGAVQAVPAPEAPLWSAASRPISSPKGSSPAILAGAGLLAFGLVAVFGGFAVAGLRRGRVPAGRSTANP